MPRKWTIRYLPIAEDDLVAIFDYIALHSVKRASSFVEKLDNRVGLLADQPLIGQIPQHPKLRENGYRVLILESYLVFYIVHGQVVEIHRVIHGSRNFDHLI